MKPTSKLLVTLVCTILFIGAFTYYVYQKARIAATESLLGSAYKCIMRARDGFRATSEWRQLTTKELHEIFAHPQCHLDGTYLEGHPVDSWGQPIWGAIRANATGAIEVVVCSNGADGISATGDDIVSSADYPSGKIGSSPRLLRKMSE